MSDDDLSMDEFLDGWALWREHMPQTAEDWVAVAERCLADPEYDTTKSEVLFQAVVLAVKQRDEARK